MKLNHYLLKQVLAFILLVLQSLWPRAYYLSSGAFSRTVLRTALAKQSGGRLPSSATKLGRERSNAWAAASYAHFATVTETRAARLASEHSVAGSPSLQDHTHTARATRRWSPRTTRATAAATCRSSPKWLASSRTRPSCARRTRASRSSSTTL